MDLIVTGRHISITESVKKAIEDKLQHIISKYSPTIKVTSAHIIIDVEKYRHIIEAELHGPHMNIYGKAATSDMYTSIDSVFGKLERQMVKYKARREKKRHIVRRNIEKSQENE